MSFLAGHMPELAAKDAKPADPRRWPTAPDPRAKTLPIGPAVRMVRAETRREETLCHRLAHPVLLEDLPPPIARAVRRLAGTYNVPPQIIVGRRRTANVAAARHHLWALIRDTLAMSYEDIGAMFRVHHTTVMSGIEKHRERAGWST